MSIKFRLRVAVMQPIDMPRKHAIKTMFVKKVRNTTIDPKNRMHANSKKRIRKLMSRRSR
jgi:hypothetical protein